MPLLLVLPAVAIPLALAATIVVCRQLADEVRALDAAVLSLRTLGSEAATARDEIAVVAVEARRRAGRAPGRR